MELDGETIKGWLLMVLSYKGKRMKPLGAIKDVEIVYCTCREEDI
jgi:hypothetical protein